jgi:hypothetical protein
MMPMFRILSSATFRSLIFIATAEISAFLLPT